jgi:hypothetical protein
MVPAQELQVPLQHPFWGDVSPSTRCRRQRALQEVGQRPANAHGRATGRLAAACEGSPFRGLSTLPKLAQPIQAKTGHHADQAIDDEVATVGDQSDSDFRPDGLRVD